MWFLFSLLITTFSMKFMHLYDLTFFVLIILVFAIWCFWKLLLHEGFIFEFLILELSWVSWLSTSYLLLIFPILLLIFLSDLSLSILNTFRFNLLFSASNLFFNWLIDIDESLVTFLTFFSSLFSFMIFFEIFISGLEWNSCSWYLFFSKSIPKMD